MLRVQRTGLVLSTTERWASSFKDRTRGLLDGPRIQPGEALVIRHARQIHTFGMTYPIDAIFCDAHWNVVHAIDTLQPGRITKWVWRGYYAVELPAGRADQVRRGDRLDYSLSER